MPSQFGANPAITGLSGPQRATGAQKPTALKWKVAGSPADGPPTTKTGTQLEQEVVRKKHELNKVIRDKEALDARLKALQDSPDIVLAPLMCGAAGACVAGDDEPRSPTSATSGSACCSSTSAGSRSSSRRWSSSRRTSARGVITTAHAFGCPRCRAQVERRRPCDNGIGLGAMAATTRPRPRSTTITPRPACAGHEVDERESAPLGTGPRKQGKPGGGSGSIGHVSRRTRPFCTKRGPGWPRRRGPGNRGSTRLLETSETAPASRMVDCAPWWSALTDMPCSIVERARAC